MASMTWNSKLLTPCKGRWKSIPCETVGLMSIREMDWWERTGFAHWVSYITPHHLDNMVLWDLIAGVWDSNKLEAPILTL